MRRFLYMKLKNIILIFALICNVVLLVLLSLNFRPSHEITNSELMHNSLNKSAAKIKSVNKSFLKKTNSTNKFQIKQENNKIEAKLYVSKNGKHNGTIEPIYELYKNYKQKEFPQRLTYFTVLIDTLYYNVSTMTLEKKDLLESLGEPDEKICDGRIELYKYEYNRDDKTWVALIYIRDGIITHVVPNMPLAHWLSIINSQKSSKTPKE